MLINIAEYKKIQMESFTFLFNNEENDIIVSTEKHIYSYLSSEDLFYRCSAEEKITPKNLFNCLKKQQNLPDALTKFIEDRTRSLIGTSIDVFVEQKPPHTMVCKENKFASFYGIKEPIPAKITVVEVFDNFKDFDASEFIENYLYGFWDIEKDEISTSFIYSHQSQVKICFPDFAKHHIEQGSLFLKFKIDLI